MCEVINRHILTSHENVLCIAENGFIAELELFLVLNRRSPLKSQSTDKLRQLHEAITLADLINSHKHNTECPCSPDAIATTTAHSQSVTRSPLHIIVKVSSISSIPDHVPMTRSLQPCSMVHQNWDLLYPQFTWASWWLLPSQCGRKSLHNVNTVLEYSVCHIHRSARMCCCVLWKTVDVNGQQ